MNAGQEILCDSSIGVSKRSTLDVLKDKKKDAQSRMEKIDEAIALFEKNPELARALDLLGSI